MLSKALLEVAHEVMDCLLGLPSDPLLPSYREFLALKRTFRSEKVKISFLGDFDLDFDLFNNVV